MDVEVLSTDTNRSASGLASEAGSDCLPEGIGSDASHASIHSNLDLEDSLSTPEDFFDDVDEDDFDEEEEEEEEDDNDFDPLASNDDDGGDQPGEPGGQALQPDTMDSDPLALSSAWPAEKDGSDANLTLSFLSVPEHMIPATSKPKGKRKYTPKDKTKTQMGPRKKKRRKGEEEEGSYGGDEAEGLEEKKKKRKNKPAHRRRNIQKFLTHGELTADTLTAQQEEEQRRKRLEEQKNAAALNGVPAFAIPPELMEILGPQESLGQDPALVPATAPIGVLADGAATAPKVPAAAAMETVEEECIVLGSSSEGEGDATTNAAARETAMQKKDVIEISSDDDAVTILSDEEEEEEAGGSLEEEEESGLHTNDALNQPDLFGRVLVNVGRPQNEEDLFLPPQIARAVKPHQIGGIRFLYDNLVESQARFRVTSGFGCILAHSMGLGKTLQMIAFIDIFLRYTEAKTVLCIVPINTLQNWVAEFDMWLPESQANGSATESEKLGKKRGPGRKAKTGCCSSSNSNSSNNGNNGCDVGVLPEGADQTAAAAAALPLAPPPPLAPVPTSGLLGEADLRSATPTLSEKSLPNDEGSTASSPASGVKASVPDACKELPVGTSRRQFQVFVMNDNYRTMAARHQIITEWHKTGGVLLMGYEMYRLLSIRGAATSSTAMAKHLNKKRKKRKTKKKKKKKDGEENEEEEEEPEIIDLEEEDKIFQMAQGLHRALCRPGPDLVVCDEGHRIKNIHAGISQALKNIRTRRRVVLTGYPLQNNLQEYWCMVDFVRPNFLGTRHEFANLFERPIQNGQCIDSTYKDVQLMRFRAHVLYSLLEGFVQRRGFSVLHSTLPPKEESVLMVRLTPFQRGLYVKFMQSFTEMGAGGWCSANPLKAFSVGCKIWNHPDILCDVLQKRDEMADLDTDLDLPETARCLKKGKKEAATRPGKKGAGAGKAAVEGEAKAEEGEAATPPPMEQSYQEKVNQIISFEWAREIMKSYQPNRLSNGGKMMLLFEILETSVRLGDRLLVFSQSLSTLSLIEKFLAKRPIPSPPDPPANFNRNWVRNKTYFRLDGSTPASDRERMINQFNQESNRSLWLFLLSTRAGCLGINLIGANRVVVLDASWNPCHDAQAVCRVYRYGQRKKCHVYRMVTDNTLEKKIYDRQISKKGMSDRVVDEMNPEMNLTKKEVESLLEFDAEADDTPYEDFSNKSSSFSDCLLSNICNDYSNFLSKAPFSTESLIWDRKDRRLTRAEKRLARKSYEEEKRMRVSFSRPSYTAFYPKDGNPSANPGANPAAARGGLMPNTFGMPVRGHPQFFNHPVQGMHPLQSTPIPRYPQNFAAPTANHQQRLAELQQSGVTMQKIVATTDIMLPGVNTPSSGPIIKAGQTVTFIKTQKGLYLRTTDGRILAVRGQANKAGLGAAVPHFGQFAALGGGAAGQAALGHQWRAAGGGESGSCSAASPSVTPGTGGGATNSQQSSASGPSLAVTSDGDADASSLQQLLDRHGFAAGAAPSLLASSTSTSTSATNGAGYPQSLQSLNDLVLREGATALEASQGMLPRGQGSAAGVTGSTPAVSLIHSASLASHVALSTKATPDHRLPPRQTQQQQAPPLMAGTVPLAAIGILGSSRPAGQPPSLLPAPMAPNKTDARLPLTLNNLLDGDHLRPTGKAPANADPDPSAIVVNITESEDE